MKRVLLFLLTLLLPAPLPNAAELSIQGTRFLLDEKPFSYVGVSFFNAIYNPNFNASTEARKRWLQKFRDHGITVLRVWCQWDSERGFADTSPSSTLYHRDGSLRNEHVQTLKEILRDADSLGICVEIALFSHESFSEGIHIAEPADDNAVTALARALMPFRNAAFQIWNEYCDSSVLPLVRKIESLDPKRLVTNSPGFSGVFGSDEENAALDYLTPHTTRQGKERHWELAPKQIATLLKKFNKPVVDDEPARNGTSQFGGPKGATSTMDHIVQIIRVWDAGGYPTYHHDMFQTGYGSPAVPPSGIPDPEFSPYHKVVFEFFRSRERYEPKH